MGVVRGAARSLAQRLRSNAQFATFPRDIREDYWAILVSAANKVKAHQSLTGLEGEELRLATGNDYADNSLAREYLSVPLRVSCFTGG